MIERKPLSMGERWRRITTTNVESNLLEKALEQLPSIRNPRIRILPGSIRAEMEGTMGSINEVSIQVPRLPTRIWPQVIRVMRRAASMQEGLKQGRVPRSFDRLIARVSGESVFPEPRKVTSACSCGAPDHPCRHILALHELFSRRLEEKAWELLVLRGVDLRSLLREAAKQHAVEDLPPLAFDAKEEPVLFPEGEREDLDSVLTAGQIQLLLGTQQVAVAVAVDQAMKVYCESPVETPDVDQTDSAESSERAQDGEESTSPPAPSAPKPMN